MPPIIFLIIAIINSNSILAPKNPKPPIANSHGNVINDNYPSKEEILWCREYLKKAGYPGRENQLNLLEFIINLKEIDYEDLANLRHLLVANYCFDELDRTSISNIDILENINTVLDKLDASSDTQEEFDISNIVSYKILEKIITFIPPLKDFEKDYRFRKNKNVFIKDLVSKFVKIIIEISAIKSTWVKVLCDKTGNNISFLQLIKDEIDSQGKRLIEECDNDWDEDPKNLILHITEELNCHFKDKIEKIKKRVFFKRNSRVTEV